MARTYHQNQSTGAEIEAIVRLQSPHFLYPEASPDLTQYIKTISPKRAILLQTEALSQPAVIAGLTPLNAAYIFTNDILEKKIALVNFFRDPAKVQQAQDLAQKAKNEDKFNQLKAYVNDKAGYFN